MAVACLASLAILAAGMAALYGLDWYKNRRRTNRKLTKKSLVKEDYAATTKEEQQPMLNNWLN
jgi:hypothetical protein